MSSPHHAPVEYDGSFLIEDESEESLWLPPRWAWKQSPDEEKLATPLDELGRVDIFKTVQVLKNSLKDEYVWPRVSLNPHHFQWPDKSYGYQPVYEGKYRVIPGTFCDLPTRKGHLPRVLENWLHVKTLTPPKPEVEVMYWSVEAWEVARGLFWHSKEGQVWARRARRREMLLEERPETLRPDYDGIDVEGERFFKEQQRSDEKGRKLFLERLMAIPPEFRLVNPEASPRRVAAVVGRLAIKGSYKLSRVANRAPAA